MRKILTILCLALVIVSCKQETAPVQEIERDTYLISGEASGVFNGIRAYLQTVDARGRRINVDTAIVMNERFQFDGKVDSPQIWNLTINSVTGDFPIVVENKAISIQVNKTNISESVVSGTKANADLMSINEQAKKLRAQSSTINAKIKASTDNKEKSKLANEFAIITREIRALPINFAKENPNSLYSLLVADSMLKGKNPNVIQIMDIFNGLDESIKTSSLGESLNSSLQAIVQQQEQQKATEIGRKAPEFTAPTPDGSMLSLKDALGKVTIVDFWAAWCGPCRRENPNVVKVYNKYHKKGLEIIGVSLDGNSRQGNAKAAWLKAIEDDNLTWNHVSNLQYFSDPVARAYNIRSIPATFILDENGTIIAKNLRGQQLEDKIAELLN